MIALVDCNNFYASCERVFRPDLVGKPIAVLSNNDGCIIARSNEAKALGIEMGTPAFKMDAEFRKKGVSVFSSNYTLYGDLSNRVMTVLSELAPSVEVYSIDEAFLDLAGFRDADLLEFSRNIVATVPKWTGIPVSVGVAPTKTLAKLANRKAKKSPAMAGVCVLDSDSSINEALASFPVADVWGIGRQHSRFLNSNGIVTAADFAACDPKWVQKHMTVVGLRMHEELRGLPRIGFEEQPPAKQTICTARGFGTMVTELQPLDEAVATYAARCAEKLRRQRSCAGAMQVFLHTNFFRTDLPQYSRSVTIEFTVATSSTAEITGYACRALRQLYRKGYHYKKVGVILSAIVPEAEVQGNVFDVVDRMRDSKLMAALDRINGVYGRDALRLGRQGFGKTWNLRQERRSPAYTTRMSDLLTVRV